MCLSLCSRKIKKHKTGHAHSSHQRLCPCGGEAGDYEGEPAGGNHSSTLTLNEELVWFEEIVNYAEELAFTPILFAAQTRR